jgi:hypothetical protein
MKNLRWITTALMALAATCSLVAAPKAKTSDNAAAPSKAKTSVKTAAKVETNAPPAAKFDLASLPKSVFKVPASPEEGINPFFPSIPKPVAVVAATNAPKVQEPTGFVLNGITGPPLRSAMINGRTFLIGEVGEVRLQTGDKVLIKCEDIGDERAVIEIGGMKKELRLRLGI